jgi:peroxiredoxin
MRKLGASMLILAFGLGLATAASANPTVGAEAPGFTVKDTTGKSRSLAEFKGKTVVLEWTNHECPYVVKHYSTGNMQALQKDLTGKGVVWLTVLSSAPGTQGAVSAAEADKLTQSRNAAPSSVLLDPDGKMGQAYGAKNTPHMYIIEPTGKLAYMGAIDDKPTTRKDDVKTAKNYVLAAMEDLSAGRPVATPRTTAYGCTVKYAY